MTINSETDAEFERRIGNLHPVGQAVARGLRAGVSDVQEAAGRMEGGNPLAALERRVSALEAAQRQRDDRDGARAAKLKASNDCHEGLITREEYEQASTSPSAEIVGQQRENAAMEEHPITELPGAPFWQSTEFWERQVATLKARLADRREALRERMLSAAMMRLPKTAPLEEVIALADQLLDFVEESDSSAPSPAPCSEQSAQAA